MAESLRAIAASKALGVKADKNWEAAEPRQRPSNKAFGVFPGGTGPRPQPKPPTGRRNNGVFYGHDEQGTRKGGVYKRGESRA